MTIAPEGLKGRGYYMAKVLFVTLDILIEIDSGLKIVGNKELWLKDPQVKINRLDLPDYITNQALSSYANNASLIFFKFMSLVQKYFRALCRWIMSSISIKCG